MRCSRLCRRLRGSTVFHSYPTPYGGGLSNSAPAGLDCRWIHPSGIPLESFCPISFEGIDLFGSCSPGYKREIRVAAPRLNCVFILTHPLRGGLSNSAPAGLDLHGLRSSHCQIDFRFGPILGKPAGLQMLLLGDSILDRLSSSPTITTWAQSFAAIVLRFCLAPRGHRRSVSGGGVRGLPSGRAGRS